MEPQDPELVKRLMEEHALQFPAFIINLYPERWASYFNHSSNSEYWVAVERNQIVGHAGFMYNNDEKLYEIVGVVVSLRHLRKGIGKTLLDHVCEAIQEKGVTEVMLHTLGHPDNEDTLVFYKSIGYSVSKFEKDYFQAGYSRVTFRKSLN
ncbi:GNAT family N-acetyltransferase [Paenibacillus sp. ACRRY]|uniref:GNAT family N-acetyltransferase n=1 Tax=Paenibacillus sp. ACRRY TaxID=2918208 RepID=UPI001EF635C3|nr:GNAT family N-acetyltransferase [Paenibacillus sp. ACRRY]